MELRHLRYFVAVAETENVSRAALKLHLSQPALSRQMRDLEQELGFPLLERSAKSVHLTEAGRVFLAEARAVLARAGEAVATARAAAAGAGELHVGYAPSLTARILPPALRAFQLESPRVRVRLHDLSTEEMLRRLGDGQLQIAFLVRPARAALRGLRFEVLVREPLRLAVPPAHAFFRRRQVTLKEVLREPLIAYSREEYPEYHEYLAAVFASFGKKPRILEEHDSVASLIAALEARCGVALVPESISCFTGSRLKLIPISPPAAPLEVGAAYAKSGAKPVVEQFLKAARAAAKMESAAGSR